MISAVVVFHSDLPRLETTLETLRPQVDELIVVDVSPRAEAIAEAPRGADVLDGGQNRGYGWACNRGIAASRGDEVLVSNSDVVYEDGSVAALAGVAVDGGLVAPLQTDHRGSRHPEHTFDSLQMGISVGASSNRWLGIGRRRFVAQRTALLTAPPAVLPVPAGMTLCGASLMASRSTWERVAGFDERFFLYQEDADLCVRCRQHGVPVQVVTDALAYHDSGSARAGLDPNIVSWSLASERSAWRSHRLPVGLLLLIQEAGMIGRAARAALTGRQDHARTWLSVALSPLWTLDTRSRADAGVG